MSAPRGQWSWNRILSGVIVGLWLALCAFVGGFSAVVEQGMLLALPLLLIWYADALVAAVMRTRGRMGETADVGRAPGCVILALAWMALLGLTLVRGIWALLTAAWWG
jgi:hypothetical protein